MVSPPWGWRPTKAEPAVLQGCDGEDAVWIRVMSMQGGRLRRATCLPAVPGCLSFGEGEDDANVCHMGGVVLNSDVQDGVVCDFGELSSS